MKASEICETAAGLVGGDRSAAYGDVTENYSNIASLWNAYLSNRAESAPISPRDAALMMLLLKVARTQLGQGNIDNFVDMAGYAGVAGEIAGGR